MGLKLKLNPTVVNVLTDVLLFLVEVAWEKAMWWLTKSDLKRIVRTGSRIFSFEELGSLAYVSSGLRKARFLMKNSALSPGEKGALISQSFLALFSLVLTISIVALGIVIDYGLDFVTETELSNSKANYSIVGLKSNDEHLEFLKLLGTSSTTFMHDCLLGDQPNPEDPEENTDLENTFQECRGFLDAIFSFSTEQVRERGSFATSIFNTLSLTRLDVINFIQCDYLAGKTDENGILLEDALASECKVVALSGLMDFKGNYTVDQENCIVTATDVRILEIELRAKPSIVYRPFQLLRTQNLLPEYREEKLRFESYESFKDDSQRKSFVDVTPIDEPVNDLLGIGIRGVNLTVDSGVHYVNDDRQALRMEHLTRRKTGSVGDLAFAVGLQSLEPIPIKVIDPNQNCTNVIGDINGKREYKMNIFYNGDLCGKYLVNGTTGPCSTMRKGFGNDLPELTVGYQEVITVLFFDEIDACGERVIEHYADEWKGSESGSTTRLGVSIQVSMICTQGYGADTLPIEDRKLYCAYGPKNMVFTEDQKWEQRPSDLSGEPNFEEIIDSNDFPGISLISWVSVTFLGTVTEDLAKVYLNVRLMVKSYFPEMLSFTNLSISRQRVLNGRVPIAFVAILTAMASQLEERSVEFKVWETATLTFLQDRYIIGMMCVLSALAACYLVALGRHIQEAVAYRKLGAQIAVPGTTTSWIRAALKSVHRSKEERAVDRPAGYNNFTLQYFERTDSDRGILRFIRDAK